LSSGSDSNGGNGGVEIAEFDIFTVEYGGTFNDSASGIGLNQNAYSNFVNNGTVTVYSGDTLQTEGYYYDDSGNGVAGTTINSGGTMVINSCGTCNEGGNNGGTLYINDNLYVYGTVNNESTDNVVISGTNGYVVGTGGVWNGYPES
jgi:hypothetical protein